MFLANLHSNVGQDYIICMDTQSILLVVVLLLYLRNPNAVPDAVKYPLKALISSDPMRNQHVNINARELQFAMVFTIRSKVRKKALKETAAFTLFISNVLQAWCAQK